MHDHASLALRGATRLLIGPLAALCLVVPVLAGPGERPDEKSEAAKVAKKMEKALATSHQAEEERAAFSGHDHLYERIKPQKGGIVYWVSGGGGSLRTGDLRATDMTAKGFDRDYHFMIVEITGDDLYFQAISRTGATIDSGVVHRPGAPTAVASTAPGPPPIHLAAPAVPPAGTSTPTPPRR